jgi:DNA repair protein RadA/Sms
MKSFLPVLIGVSKKQPGKNACPPGHKAITESRKGYFVPKTRTQYVCQQCGRVSAREMGRCPQCGVWNSMVEEIVTITPPVAAGHTNRLLGARSTPRRMAEITGDVDQRLPLSIGEFARVLGGGVVPGSVVLIGGDPGIGKSTLLLQVALEMARRIVVLYVSGEESERQIKMRAQRLLRLGNQGDGKEELKEHSIPDDLFLATETNLGVILEHVNEVKPALLIVDSVQTTYLQELDSSAGSVSQVRETASRLREMAKASGVAVFLIGHVTKEGAIAGPRVLEHIVDTVLYLEGDRFQSYRLLRSVKNRFGATSEVGVFEMGERGMTEVTNPSEAFLAERMVNAPGSAIAVCMEGTRPLLIEIQGLTSPTSFGNPRRTPNGVDFNRLLLIVAVLSRRVGLHLGEQDVFINVVGGITVDEPATDLAVATTIASSLRGVPIRADAILIGEIGLSGELRMVGQMASRLREAARLGFRTAVVPRRLRVTEPWPDDIQIIEARSLRQALDHALIPEEKG